MLHHVPYLHQIFKHTCLRKTVKPKSDWKNLARRYTTAIINTCAGSQTDLFKKGRDQHLRGVNTFGIFFDILITEAYSKREESGTKEAFVFHLE